MTQKDKLFHLLQDREWHGNEELNRICFAFSQRLGEMRRERLIDFETRREEGNQAHCFYRLTITEPSVIVEEDGQILLPMTKF